MTAPEPSPPTVLTEDPARHLIEAHLLYELGWEWSAEPGVPSPQEAISGAVDRMLDLLADRVAAAVQAAVLADRRKRYCGCA